MKTWIQDYLCCPLCQSSVEVAGFEHQDDEVWAGVISCQDADCHAWYPVVRGIPRMLPETLQPALRREFIDTYGERLVQHLVQPPALPSDDLQQLKKETIQNFGFEWIEYARFGWDGDLYNIDREKDVFAYKSLIQPAEMDGKLVLDAGCGNGRYTYWASQYSGRVIGIDLGDGVESAAKNTKGMPNVQIVQGDIFNLPFPLQTFDQIFSIGVLMHTGDAERATISLTSKLKPQGSITIHLYGKGNPIYEFVDRRLRNRTTRMSIEDLMRFTNRAFRLRRVLDRLSLGKLANLVVRLDSHPHCIFDWYAAPIATHHTYSEVEIWFERLGLEAIASNTQVGQSSNRMVNWLRSALGATTVTLRGVKRS